MGCGYYVSDLISPATLWRESVGIDGGHLIGGQLSAADDSYDYSHCGRSRSNQHPCLLVAEFVVALMDALSVREVPNPSMIHRSG